MHAGSVEEDVLKVGVVILIVSMVQLDSNGKTLHSGLSMYITTLSFVLHNPYCFSDQNQQELTELEQQLQAMKEERDDALLKMTNAQEQADMNAESIRNLQTVLEQFQRGE